MEIISLIKEQIDDALKNIGITNLSEEYVVEIPHRMNWVIFLPIFLSF